MCDLADLIERVGGEQVLEVAKIICEASCENDFRLDKSVPFKLFPPFKTTEYRYDADLSAPAL